VIAMLTLRFRFPARRYHATPWGAHVNEGLIEWPPSPWRVLRAIIAVGFARDGWTEIPETARVLFEKLAGTLPTMHLPPASAAHTRHFMPPFSGNTMKVFDAFAYVGDGALAIRWDVAVTSDEAQLLDSLLDAMPYLGRAESWVEAERIEEIPKDLVACVASDVCPGPDLERIALLAPETPAAYAAWRESAVQREEVRSLAELVVRAQENGKAPPTRLGKKDIARINGIFPQDAVEALLASTRTLQTQGWSQPPATRWVSYWRSKDALRSPPRSVAFARRGPNPTMALLALASDTKNGEALPAMSDAVWRLETIHDALVRLSDRGGHGASPVLSGKENGAPMRGHRHATLIPLTIDRRIGRLDHVLVHAPMGFDDDARVALTRLSRTYAKNLPTIFVTLAGTGNREDFVKLVPAVRTALIFRSVTPFVPPRFLKRRGKDALDEQIQAELERRGLPRAESVALLADGRTRFRAFRKARRDPERAPPVVLGVGIRLRFAEPVDGPISLGYGSHLGLGSFEPEGAP
jgi:CRISPR-associated protein Csb2